MVVIILDTNAFYWYYGRDLLEMSSAAKINVTALKRFLDGTERKALSSTSYQEVIVHFRNDPPPKNQGPC